MDQLIHRHHLTSSDPPTYPKKKILEQMCIEKHHEKDVIDFQLDV